MTSAEARCSTAPSYRDAQPETMRRYLRMLGETLPEGCARCCEAIRDLGRRDDQAGIDAPTTGEEIGDVLLHNPLYCGVPATSGAFPVAQRVLAE